MSFMKERSFIDTNILIYVDDDDNPEKQKAAIKLIESGWHNGNIVLSTQVLQEYFSAVTRKLKVPADKAQRKIELLSHLEIASIEHPDIVRAIELHRLHSFSFWDSLIVRMAQKTACAVLYSEDMQDGRKLDGLTIVNPFKT